MLRFAGALVLATLLASCGTTTCDRGAFSIGASHMTNPIRAPFVVRELRGRMVPDFTDQHDVAWVSEENFRFQLIGPDGAAILVRVAPDGRFSMPHLAPGRYCFRTSSEWFQGYEGVIIIDPHAPADEIVISVALGA